MIPAAAPKIKLFLAVFFLYPFTQIAWEAFSGPGGVTLSHFATMVNYWKFPAALENTLLLAVAVVPLQAAMALAMAVLVSKLEKGRDIILYIFTIPLGISDLAAGLIWFGLYCFADARYRKV